MQPTLDKVADAIDRSIDFSVDVFSINIDFITSLASFIGALCCVYLSVIILRERAPYVTAQRWSLGFLAVALLANSITFYPEWAMIQGHRPTGAIVDVLLMVALIIMAARGHIIYQPGRHHDHGDHEGVPG